MILMTYCCGACGIVLLLLLRLRPPFNQGNAFASFAEVNKKYISGYIYTFFRFIYAKSSYNSFNNNKKSICGNQDSIYFITLSVKSSSGLCFLG